MAELTTQRTVALREALSNDPDAAFLAVLHALVLGAFYRSAAAYTSGYIYSGHGRGAESCLEIQFRSTEPGRDVPNLAEAPGAIALERRRREWQERLPKEGVRLWDALIGLDADSRADLFALCAGMAVEAEGEALPALLEGEGDVPADDVAAPRTVAVPEPGEEPQIGAEEVEDRSWDIDAFEEDPESDAEARALADAERRDDRRRRFPLGRVPAEVGAPEPSLWREEL